MEGDDVNPLSEIEPRRHLVLNVPHILWYATMGIICIRGLFFALSNAGGAIHHVGFCITPRGAKIEGLELI